MNKLKTAIAACLCATVVSAWGDKKPTTERWLDPVSYTHLNTSFAPF